MKKKVIYVCHHAEITQNKFTKICFTSVMNGTLSFFQSNNKVNISVSNLNNVVQFTS